MSTKTKIRKIDVKFTLDGKVRHPTQIVAVSRVNAYPTVTVTHHLNKSASQSAVDMSSADVCQDMGKRQKRMFTENHAVASLKVTDGNGGTLKFDGYVLSPNYTFGPNTVNLSDIILPEYAVMENANLSCYCAGKSTADLTKDYIVFPMLEEHKTIPKLTIEHTKWLRKCWQDGKPDNDEECSRIVVQEEEQDRINQEALKPFRELLDNSEKTFGWLELVDWISSGSVSQEEAILDVFVRTFTNCAGSFFSSICRFAEAYQCLYVPDWNKVGVLVNRNTLMENPVKYTAEIAELTIQAGGQGMFPVRYVAVSGENINADISLDPAVPASYVCFPEELVASGSMIPVNAPSWLPSAVYETEIDQKGKLPSQIRALRASLPDKKKDKVVKVHKEQVKKTKEILREWAKSCYYWEALGTTNVRVVVPLDFSIKLGTRYKIYNVKKEYLFTGYLREIQHTVSSAVNGRGQCHTTLMFSHVELPEFTLPT